MIVFSLLLILVAVVLLVLGLAGGSSALLIASIVASLLAAIALVIGARRAAAARRAPEADPGYAAFPEPAAAPDHAEAAAYAGAHAAPEPGLAAETAAYTAGTDDVDAAFRSGAATNLGAGDDLLVPETAFADAGPGDIWKDPVPAARRGEPGLLDDFAEPDPEDPEDEPLPQQVRPADEVRVARMTAEVVVVDGRPRYHVSDCAFLAGRETEPLSAAEAVELGFTPCGLCRPVDWLVAAAARH